MSNRRDFLKLLPFAVAAAGCLHIRREDKVTRPQVSLPQIQQSLLQRYEQTVRMSNGVWYIEPSRGLTPEDFDGVPGEVVVLKQCDVGPVYDLWEST